jgi:two-component system response regulator VicR
MDTPTTPTLNKKILIVEDDDFLRGLAVTKLQKSGFTVDIGIDGEEGIRKLHESKPDILLLDLMLPHVDGFNVLEHIQQDPTLNTGMKIIIFSNLGTDEDIARATKLGAHDYMVKSSFTLDELVIKIRQHIA